MQHVATPARSFDELVDEAASAPVDGWDFSWLDGRATEERPSWGYQRLLGERLARARAALDIQTGGGEVLAVAVARAAARPPMMLATEGWPPNALRARALLSPFGVTVVEPPDDSPLPFPDATFDLVTSRHPATVDWECIARVLTPGGTYFAQHVGDRANVELHELLLGPHVPNDHRAPDVEAARAEAAGLEVVQLRNERLELRFSDVGAVVWFLRKVIWTAPGFTVEEHRDRLLAIHEQIRRDGVLRSTTSRTLIEARRPRG
jgi:SAM-dependent methyltransferase